MDGEVLNTAPSKELSFSETFRSQFPQYLAIGMTYAEYWDCDPYLCVYYREAHKQKMLIDNTNQWRQGMYNFVAFQTVLSNAFSKKGSKPKEYPKEPFRIFEKTEEELKAEQEMNTRKTIESLNRLKAKWDISHKEESIE